MHIPTNEELNKMIDTIQESYNDFEEIKKLLYVAIMTRSKLAINKVEEKVKKINEDKDFIIENTKDLVFQQDDTELKMLFVALLKENDDMNNYVNNILALIKGE